MSSPATIVAAIQALLTDADAVIAAALDDEYSSADEYEAAANELRETIVDLVDQVNDEWGVEGWPTVKALHELAARLLDLRTAISNATSTVEVELTRTTSLLELAVELYEDHERWTELAELNPNLQHPGFVAPGTVVVAYAQ